MQRVRGIGYRRRASPICSIFFCWKRPLTRSATKRRTGLRGSAYRSTDWRASPPGSSRRQRNREMDDDLSLVPELWAVIEGRSLDPFAVLGRHRTASGDVVRVMLPGAFAVTAIARDG